MANPYLPKHAETGDGREAALRQVSAPAIGLMVLAAVGAMIGIIQAFGVIITFCVIAADKGLPGSHEALGVYSVFGGGALAGLLAAAVYAVIFFGAWSMKNLKRQIFAIAAAVLALISCCSPCFLIGAPLGVWALITLNSPNVKSAFR